MARYKDYSYDQHKLLPIAFREQILPGTFVFLPERNEKASDIQRQPFPVTLVWAWCPFCGHVPWVRCVRRGRAYRPFHSRPFKSCRITVYLPSRL